MVRGLLLVAVCASVLLGCSQQADDQTEGTVITNIEQMRTEKDNYFRSGDHSPLPEEQRDAFKGLHYFPVDDAYVVDAQFTPLQDKTTFQMATTSNEPRDAVRAGQFTFVLNGTECTLTAYQFVGSDHPTYFVPFMDATTGSETYGTGRYLDIEISQGATSYVIDFNEAYNPYCAYNENYSCPVTPSENTLPVAVKAGEKSWEAH